MLAASDAIGQALDRATRGDGKCLGLAGANAELRGVFTVSWNQPAPDGDGTLISNAVLHALVQHFNSKDISSRNVQPDILGRAYEYLLMDGLRGGSVTGRFKVYHPGRFKMYHPGAA